MSTLSPAGISQIASPVAGSKVVNVFPDAAATHLPLMSMCFVFVSHRDFPLPL